MKNCKLLNFVMIIALFIAPISFQIITEKPLTSISKHRESSSFTLNPTAYTKTEELKLKIEFIGFNRNLIDEISIENQLISNFQFSQAVPQAEINFNFEFNHISNADKTELENYINSTAVNGTGTGYKLNKTLLLEDLISGNRSDVFIPRDGMSIDAELINEYINEHLYQEPVNDPGYTFYIMNFSLFDSPDHSLEHWYETTGVGLDSNRTITWWYSGYKGLEKRAAMGWGGKYRFCYLDLSARSWYLDYVRTAWSQYGIGSYSFYDYPDLDNLSQTVDITTPDGQDVLTEYLIDWINSYIGNVLSGPVYNDLPIGRSVSLQVMVINNLTINGFDERDLKWCISKNRIIDQLVLDFPWINWLIDIEWLELTDYPEYFYYLQENIEEDVNGKYIEVSDGFFFELEDDLITNFNLSRAEIVLPCYFFITNDVSFRWNGVSFAGLGGMSWEILLGDQYSLFEDGNTSLPKRDMSTVMIHELGHSLGLPHPHSSTFGWGSSFINEVMSYFSTSPSFSTFYKDAIGRAHSDAHYIYALEELNTTMERYEYEGRPIELNDLLDEIDNTLDSISLYYQQMDYNASASLGIHVRSLIQDTMDYFQETGNFGYLGFLALLIIPVVIIAVLVNRKRAIK